MHIPFIGEVSTATLAFAGVATLIGYVIGSQLKSAIKVAFILLFVVAAAGFITPAMLGQIAEYIVALKPLATSLIQSQGDLTLSAAAFIVGFMIGLAKG